MSQTKRPIRTNEILENLARADQERDALQTELDVLQTKLNKVKTELGRNKKYMYISLSGNGILLVVVIILAILRHRS